MRKPPFYQSLYYAVRGLIWILRNERNFQYEILGLLINLFLMVYLQLSALDALLILLACFLVLMAETFNTCLEKICDLISPDYDERIKIIKNMAAGGVVLSVVSAVIAAVFIYPKYFF